MHREINKKVCFKDISCNIEVSKINLSDIKKHPEKSGCFILLKAII